ncbi:YHS domain protein [Aestuariirhabdus sp. Z084]|uniref:YHS domain-containing (seleno)protein n=1 Tax=Aestuariirhabdus haliotis TaxID=2918751 RepID=UPI00201B3FA3|nr:YHS domain-containing (seleno)protein [Aestuariirhabdus haliotis]MCL6417377.1 YHS domain protein [Aestuariirhabdus haliotis]MCL6421326.1 YHS domain protein [Aestuariirhabdus haliotis]
MMTMLKNGLLLLFLTSSGLIWAADPEVFSHKRLGAIKGYDPVAYFSLNPGDPAVKGKEEYKHVWKGTEWRFSNAQNRDAFIANPERYAPQYGGYCAFASAHNFTASTRPDSWSIIDGKLYLNHNSASEKNFLEDPSSYIARGQENWPNLLKRCEERGACREAFNLRHL